MKKKCQKKKNKKIFKGFTLVELLAVIVILAIIMILAIPSVLSVMKTSKKSSFVEYITKVYMKAEEKSLTDEINNNSTKCTIYNINEMFDNTGNYDGYVMVVKSNDETKYYITMWDTEYMVSALEYSGDISEKDLKTFTNSNDEILTKEHMVSSAGGISCTDSANNQIYYTGTKEVVASVGHWTAHYTKGVMDACYLTENTFSSPPSFELENGRTISGKFVIKGGPEYYCTGSVQSFSESECYAAKSLECCTGPVATDKTDPTQKNYYIYYPDNKSCGRFKVYYDDTGKYFQDMALHLDGAGLPATNYTG